jgi:hypothetical protein
MAMTTGQVRLQTDNRRVSRGHLIVSSLRLGLMLVALLALLSGCGGENETGIHIGPQGGQATLTWIPVAGDNVVGYVVHYGTASSQSNGSCGYEQALFVSSPEAFIGGLAENTTYYFAVSAYNGIEGPCSDEVSKYVGPLAA